ncbi:MULTISPECIES: hypothetical protein [Actinoalloteichus]|uniref:Uncharacterized protein n=1 Tax=Actinoalloteichus fjordicus TaxID=1612552 RepID=A0AAC9L7M4_9PSEU|nr:MULTISPECIES: hypothetical protein [Actinoalloteichus]APU12873.1 hypothetical protein UA74_03970 [Actinoalloteichus fjordicus]APU18845.1 hypothetical protein UA75_04070 [Actinoalloteichus sp. GBA129-24]
MSQKYTVSTVALILLVIIGVFMALEVFSTEVGSLSIGVVGCGAALAFFMINRKQTE